jgi:acyl-CoA synthetase (AMP-forming)/AMP-acid ligase II
MTEHLQKTALEKPNLIAIKSETKNFTYKEIDDWANQRARVFRELGAKSGDHIGILSENSVSYLVWVTTIFFGHCNEFFF